jgi:murein DD-endopeptidase MepM/ murein hydrolase activator NlpD
MKRTVARLGLLLLAWGLAAGCAPAPPAWLKPVPDAEAVGVFHTVAAGQTLGEICRLYGADLQEVAEVNGIVDPDRIEVGQRIFIPDAEPLPDAAQPPPAPAEQKVERYQGRFIWPVDGVLTSKYGIRHGRRHDGIDIGAPIGTPIRAAADGKVLYVGRQSGYGKIVILRHAERMITVYAHNHENLVDSDQSVRQGQPIARVGQTGRATGPHLHFEIRKATKPRNPLFFLPKPD